MFQIYIKSNSLQCAAARLPQSELTAYIRYFQDNGYAHATIHHYLCEVIHFNEWLITRGINYKTVTVRDKHDFIQERTSQINSNPLFRFNKKTYATAITHWIRSLTNNVDILSTNNALVLEYDRYLEEVSGLAISTRLYRCRNVLEFLKWCTLSGLTQIKAIQLKHLSAFVLLRTSQVSLATVAVTACSLNSFIRFLTARGYGDFTADTRVPYPKLLHRTPSNKSLTTCELNLLLDSIDRTIPMGKRDYAIMRCLIDLGVRTSEVANIYLTDIDWRKSQITIHAGKTRRQLVFPIRERLLEAFMDYVLHARPNTTSKKVFVYHCAALGNGIKATTVRAVVRRVFLKAGFAPEQSQVHRLRHAMATRLLTSKVPLKVIADVLGHQSINTTVRYTYVDKESLTTVVMPWPNISGGNV